ncbi:hypothetical protein VZT92_024143 [Zoarces viviparus]|uniref:Uncharacterized protein n=1 Tax=Zoarces viviparus TaxID=48416 RepID=A0AAW1E237_ZOAVI
MMMEVNDRQSQAPRAAGRGSWLRGAEVRPGHSVPSTTCELESGTGARKQSSESVMDELLSVHINQVISPTVMVAVRFAAFHS